MATTPPIKKPTAILLWNFRMIIVPPMLNARSINADHTLVKPSAKDRVPMTAQDMRARMPVTPRIEYLQPNNPENKSALQMMIKAAGQGDISTIVPPTSN